MYKVPTFVKVQSATRAVMDARTFGTAVPLGDSGDAPIDGDGSAPRGVSNLEGLWSAALASSRFAELDADGGCRSLWTVATVERATLEGGL